MATTTDPAPDAPSLGQDPGTPAEASPAVDGVRGGSPFPYRTIAMGTIGSLLLLLGALGAAGILIRDPVIGAGPLSWLRYGHGRMLANAVLYGGFALVVWAWVRLGRYMLAGRIGSKPILVAAACWMGPLIISPPLFTRDVFSYLGQGAQLLHGLNPYAHGPAELTILPNVVQNVHPVWQTTPAPYGPLFLLVAKGIVAVTGDNVIAGVIVTRLVLLVGLGAMVWALPRLVRHLGGKVPIAMWLAVASPMTVIHLVGGPHNDLLMIGALTVGVLAALERKHVLAVALVTVGMLIKPTAAIALPFLVWVWVNHLPGDNRMRNLVKAGAASLGIFAVVFVAGTWVSLGSVNLGWVTGLKAPQLVTNWLNPSTGIGQIVYTVVHLVVNVPESPFVTVARLFSWLALAVFFVRQWWKARFGGNEAIFRMAMTLLATAILAPPTLPWYLTWGFVVAAAFPWRRRHLAIVVAVAIFLVMAYYPTGEQALYDWWFVAVTIAFGLYAAASLLRPDPLGLVGAWQRQRAGSAAASTGTVAEGGQVPAR
ncbi:polyprenol phosphomannose-dependent alpha 1,6 mannosyltransferase MptB [Amycolatopsis cynarae]|uniref:Polyprenol phosphomannose-dependent alpha 1,6 mannosyltransferase MptB n=1 Tax=Amycolatopsis cynarae TaxID=2995223 RepID=A0ABY7BDE0_9PSEU|nr:polyprenol phosphomannose-dependent alpha 1,6 mannosyltransferase MptB [Amycolatopsis sp. HUAS 11-8]WAL69163.1 polyprenol phosphomannose-dependent alpha 1,6 mannosyltransferase MptB [Amycolatopsis sp. HUAS 11-8]